MKIVNSKKENVRILAVSNIKNSITQLQTCSNNLHETISQVDCLLGGSKVESDKLLNDICRRSLVHIISANENLHLSLIMARELDTKDEVVDDV